MSSKYMQKKSKGRKNYPLEAKEVAAIAGTSESYVKQVRTSETSGVSLEGKKAKLIKSIDIAAEQNKSLLIQEIKRVIQF